ncbi:MAG: hypothetical protein ACREX0_08940 [Noviherbaspirillum sp.]
MQHLLIPLVLAFSAPAYSQDFAARMAAGNAKNLSETEQRYNRSIGNAVRRGFDLRKCWPTAQEGYRMELRLVADTVALTEIPSRAKLSNVVVDPDSPASQCFIERLQGITVPSPPRSPLPYATVIVIVNN